jgi:hypothetical protein
MARTRRKGESSQYFEDGRVRSGQDYAQILGEVLRSEAFRCLPDYATRVLFALACQFRSNNNGNLSLVSSAAAPFGINAEWKRAAGLTLLERVGLIEVMRRGHIAAGKGICSTYALGWRQIDPGAHYDQPLVMAIRAPNRWAKWKRPDDWSQQLQELQRKFKGSSSTWKQALEKSHSRRGEQATPDVGSETGSLGSTRGEREQQIPTPDVGVTFKNLASPSRPRQPRALGQQLADLKLADMVALARAHPEIDAPTLAKRCKASEAAAHRALQQLHAEAIR